MASKVVLFADSTCDLGEELLRENNIHVMPYHIMLDEKEYIDNVTISVSEIYQAWWDKKLLPKTSAVSIGEFLEAFKPWLDQGYEVVHINLGAALSASNLNCRLASEELPGIYPVDSKNLSTGTGHLVLEAARMRDAGASAAEIQQALNAMTGKVHTSFILDTLEFMHAGGRCSAIAMLGANILSLKPCISVDNSSGAMGVTKKYRGKLNSVLKQYVKDQLAAYSDIRTDKIFITSSTPMKEYAEMVREILLETLPFEKIYVTNASCTVASHCGPNCLGILFMTEK